MVVMDAGQQFDLAMEEITNACKRLSERKVPIWMVKRALAMNLLAAVEIGKQFKAGTIDSNSTSASELREIMAPILDQKLDELYEYLGEEKWKKS